jgi:hypothetical protein
MYGRETRIKPSGRCFYVISDNVYGYSKHWKEGVKKTGLHEIFMEAFAICFYWWLVPGMGISAKSAAGNRSQPPEIL